MEKEKKNYVKRGILKKGKDGEKMVTFKELQAICLKQVIEFPDTFKELPKDVVTDSFCRSVLKHHPYLIRDIENPSFELCLYAVQQPARSIEKTALMGIKNPSEYLQFEAIKYHPQLIARTEQISQRAVFEVLKRAPWMISHLVLSDSEEILTVLTHDERLWERVWEDMEEIAADLDEEFFLMAFNVLSKEAQVVHPMVNDVLPKLRQLVANSFNSQHSASFLSADQEKMTTYDLVRAIEKDPLLFCHFTNRSKSYRLSRYAVRQAKRNGWFSPYHVLERYEQYVALSPYERAIEFEE